MMIVIQQTIIIIILLFIHCNNFYVIAAPEHMCGVYNSIDRCSSHLFNGLNLSSMGILKFDANSLVNIIVYRDTLQLSSGDQFIPGETLHVMISSYIGSAGLIDVNSSVAILGQQGTTSCCNGARFPSNIGESRNTTLTISSTTDSDLVINLAWALNQSYLILAPSFLLLNPAGQMCSNKYLICNNNCTDIKSTCYANCLSSDAICLNTCESNYNICKNSCIDGVTSCCIVNPFEEDCRSACSNDPYLSWCPTFSPTGGPTSMPTTEPTFHPTNPTGQPSGMPTGEPTFKPTNIPTYEPTLVPTIYIPPTAAYTIKQVIFGITFNQILDPHIQNAFIHTYAVFLGNTNILHILESWLRIDMVANTAETLSQSGVQVTTVLTIPNTISLASIPSLSLLQFQLNNTVQFASVLHANILNMTSGTNLTVVAEPAVIFAFSNAPTLAPVTPSTITTSIISQTDIIILCVLLLVVFPIIVISILMYFRCNRWIRRGYRDRLSLFSLLEGAENAADV